MRIYLLYIIFIVIIPVSAIAQQNYSTTNKKAIKLYEEALVAYNSANYSNAVELMKKAIKLDSQFVEAHIVLAEIYINTIERKNAIDSYRQVIEISPDFFPALYLSLAQLEMMESEFQQAKIHLEKFLNYKNQNPNSIQIANKKLESCVFAMDAIKNPVPFVPFNLGDQINTLFDEYWPSITADEQTLIITRLIPKDLNSKQSQNNAESNAIPNKLGLNDVQEDFYISFKENDFWTEATNLGKPINTEGNEGAQTIVVDGRLMYFTACNRTDGVGRCDIYSSVKTGDQWSEPQNVGKPVNTASWEAQPSVSADGSTLYFVSNRGGGLGQKDIWVSTLNKDNTWSIPINLGDKINSLGDEQSPFIHPDNKTLYFASNGRTGMGGFDLYMIKKQDDNSWTDPVNLGYPINTVFDEVGLIVNAKGNKAYFSSDRFSERGRDIFEFELYEKVRPRAVSYLKGTVVDAENKKSLEAQFELINIESKATIMSSQSDSKTGKFLVSIPTDCDYALNVSKEGYLFYSEHFSLKGIHEINDPYLKDVELKRIKKGETIILKNVFYETDSYELNNKSMAELIRLIAFLNTNPGLKIEISGHTDNVGNAEYNLKLSENRAKSVYTYIISQGIDSNRLVYKGYGETQALDSNTSELGRAQNRRTQIKIL